MKILNIFKRNSNVQKFAFLRYYSRTFQQTYQIETFCNVKINVPFNITVQPLDVHQYPECNTINIQSSGLNSDSSPIKYERNGRDVNISADTQENPKDVSCNVEVPIKANLNVKSDGSIKAGFFNGSELVLASKNGDIDVEKYQGDNVDITTINGNINFNGSIEAINLKANILEVGSITAKRLLALNVDFHTKNGNISLASSYCDNSKFSVENGNMTLQNLHKTSRIMIEKGNLDLGLDGSVDLAIGEGNADIHISRILEDSKIDLKKGDLVLKISESCNNTAFEIVGRNATTNQLPTNLKSSINNEILRLTPTDSINNLVRINSDSIVIKTATWSDIFKLK